PTPIWRAPAPWRRWAWIRSRGDGRAMARTRDEVLLHRSMARALDIRTQAEREEYPPAFHEAYRMVYAIQRELYHRARGMRSGPSLPRCRAATWARRSRGCTLATWTPSVPAPLQGLGWRAWRC